MKHVSNLIMLEDALVKNSFNMNAIHHILLQILWAKKSLFLTEVNSIFVKLIQKYQAGL